MLKRFLSESASFSNLRYYIKRYYNGELLYLAARSIKSQQYLGCFIIDLNIEKGSFVTITGPSGSGKTTLLLTIGGLLRPNSGKMVFNNQELEIGSETQMSEFRRQHIGYVMQSFALIPYLTALENVMVGYTNNSSGYKNKKNIASYVLDIVNLSDRKNHCPSELSAGQQQRVAIARTLLKNPALIIFDEATSALDSQTEKAIQEEINKLTTNRTALIIAHRLSTIVHASQILVMQEGEIVESGTHEDLMSYASKYATMWNLQQNEIEVPVLENTTINI